VQYRKIGTASHEEYNVEITHKMQLNKLKSVSYKTNKFDNIESAYE